MQPMKRKPIRDLSSKGIIPYRLLRFGFLCTVWFMLSSTVGFSQEPSPPPDSPEAEVAITYQSAEGLKTTRTGRILVRAVDGGILFEERNGHYWTIIRESIYEERLTGNKFKYFSPEELKQNILKELPNDFQTWTSKRYLLFSNMPQEYSDWCVKLLEQLCNSFHRDWKNSVVKTRPLETPLIVILFTRQSEMAEYSRKENLQKNIPNKGFYSPQTNRVVLVDLSRNTPLPQLRNRQADPRTYQDAMFNAATIVHEATHQLCFNTGLMNRFADNPLWLSEGLAMYYETPNERSRNGWSGGGKLNHSRLLEYKTFRAQVESEKSLPSLIESSQRFSKAETAGGAYAEAWMLTYYLMKKRKGDLSTYLKTIASKPPLIFEDETAHRQDFEAVFGKDWQKLGKAVNRYTDRLKVK